MAIFSIDFPVCYRLQDNRRAVKCKTFNRENDCEAEWVENKNETWAIQL